MIKKKNLTINEKSVKKEGIKSNWYQVYMKNKDRPKPDWVPKPLKKKCFRCKSNILINFVVPQKDYSKKNNWDYWTEKEEDENKKICDKCLVKLYNDKILYWKTIANLRKRQRMRTYIYTGIILS